MGNPGTTASWAYGVYKDKKEIHSEAGILKGELTNNIAEFTGVLKALQWVTAQKLDNIVVKGDSQLVIEQLKGNYKTRSRTSKRFVPEIMALIKNKDVEFMWIPRDKNKKADWLCRKAVRQASSKEIRVTHNVQEGVR